MLLGPILDKLRKSILPQFFEFPRTKHSSYANWRDAFGGYHPTSHAGKLNAGMRLHSKSESPPFRRNPMTLLFFVVPMAAGAVAPLLPGPMRRYLGIYAAAVMASLFGLALAQAPASSWGSHHASFSYPWVPELGVNLSFILDGYSLLFVLLITGIGTLIFLYSQRYMGRHTHTLKFYCWMLIFAGSMLGLVTSANLIVLYLFWEMTTISSFFLIGLSDEVSRARRNAMRALLITVLGGLAMLAGFVLIYITLGTFELEEVLARASELRESPLLTPIVILVLLGAVTKSAIFPFHIWLPSAMVAPTPVSAYLHSATMVKAGIYLVARFSPVFAGIASWELTLVVLGLITLIVGGLLALRQNDLKALLAYSTISQLGMMIALYGLGTELAAGAATMLLMSHAVFKGALFLVAGTIEYEIGTREVNSLEGLAYLMPALAGIAAVVVLSLGGIPPLSGFVSKEILLDASLNVPHSAHAFHWLATSVLVIGSAVTLAYSLKFLIGAFGGRYQGPRSFRPRVPNALVLVPGVLAVATVAIGIRPEFVDSWLISPAVESLVGHPYKVGLHLWGGFKLSLLLSIIAITLGIVAYNFRRQINHRVWSFMGRRLTHRGLAERGFQQGMDIMDHSVPRMYLWFQNGDLRRYICGRSLGRHGAGSYGVGSFRRAPLLAPRGGRQPGRPRLRLGPVPGYGSRRVAVPTSPSGNGPSTGIRRRAGDGCLCLVQRAGPGPHPTGD